MTDDAKTGDGPDGGANAAQEAFAEAQHHHQAGRLAEAEALYRRLLVLAPDHPAILHRLGIIAIQRGDEAAAETLIARSLAADDSDGEAHNNLGVILKNQGRIEEAATHYRRAIALDPNNAAAHNNLGVALMSRDCLREAVACYRRALAINPEYIEAYTNLGTALFAQGLLDEAIASHEQALARNPNLAEAHNSRGAALEGQGRLDEAIASYRRAIALKPGFAEAHNNLGNLQHKQGDVEEAVASYRRAIALKPDFAEAHNNLGSAFQDLDRPEEAIASHRRALALRPEFVEALNNLGNALRLHDRPSEAVASYRRAIALKPHFADAHDNLGIVLKEQGQLAEAIASHRCALALRPDHAETVYNLGDALQASGRLEEAIACYRHALALKPTLAAAHNNLGNALRSQGRLQEASASYRRAMELEPSELSYYSNLLLGLQYDGSMTPASLFREHCGYGARAPRPSPHPHLNPRDPSKRLKVGYVSPDLRRHPVGYFVSPVLASHDRASFAVHCYYGSTQEDDLTVACKRAAEIWRSTVRMKDAELEATIRADGIDILIDLSGHTRGNRLPVFARKPAPIQVTWAGYVGTTGLSAIDYLITDRWESPPGSESYAVEQLLRLDDGYICYRPPDEAPPVGALPAAGPGAVTFGCFNNFAKVNSQVIALWSRLLEILPAARLVLKTGEFHDHATRARVAALFAAEGVRGERIALEGHSPHHELLRRYHDIDIALDPFPYSGGLTTIESLWMGVPVVTLGGDTFASRHTLSHLNAVGLGELVAASLSDYLKIAQDLARDIPRLAALRADLRRCMSASPMLQAERFTRGLEAAFRHMWKSWCLEH